MSWVNFHNAVVVLASVKKIPAVSITNNMFFNDSGTASANKSDVAARMNFCIKSNTVNHNAVKVGNVVNGVKCCKNTLPNNVAALVLVSSMAVFSPGLLLTRRWSSIGKRTLVKVASHSAGVNVFRSWKRSALCKVVNAEVRM